MKKRRQFTYEEKLAVINDAQHLGVTETIRKYNISIGTYYNWKGIAAINGIDGLKKSHQRINPELKRLQLENLRLKNLLADKELALMIKDELLKKTMRTDRKS